jgi:hypothetical protein
MSTLRCISFLGDLNYSNLVRYSSLLPMLISSSNLLNYPSQGRMESSRSDINRKVYSLRFSIRNRLGQRHGHQSTTLTSIFYI